MKALAKAGTAGCLAGVVLVAGAGSAGAQGSGFVTQVKPYAVGTPGSGWTTRPIISSGDIVPETGNPGARYRMVGIPDGLGVHAKGKRVRVFMTHEFASVDSAGQPVVTEPRVGRPAQRGAFASTFLLNRAGRVVSARRMFARVYQDSTFVGPAAAADNTTPAFSRWCSAFLAGRRVGFDRPVFFANEETGPRSGSPGGDTQAFNALGSQSVAIFNNEAHALSRLGHFSRENTVVMRGTGKRTVIMITEDGPRTTDSQLYLYVGRKVRSSSNVLTRNGLNNGKLYAFASDDARDNENALLQGDSVRGHWVEIPNAATLNDVATEQALDAAGAFGFVRLEDGAFRPNRKREFWFNATGDQSKINEGDPHYNELGRTYRLRFRKSNPLAGATLKQVYNADQLTSAQDGPLTPDNLDLTGRRAFINEDGTAGGSPADRRSGADPTSGSRDDMDYRGRDGSIWMLPLATAGNPATFRRVAELVGRSQGGRDGIPTVDEHGNRAGVWETSGIVDARLAFGRNTFLFDVQAHAPTTPPGGKTVTGEDGQLLLLRRAKP